MTKVLSSDAFEGCLAEGAGPFIGLEKWEAADEWDDDYVEPTTGDPTGCDGDYVGCELCHDDIMYYYGNFGERFGRDISIEEYKIELERRMTFRLAYFGKAPDLQWND